MSVNVSRLIRLMSRSEVETKDVYANKKRRQKHMHDTATNKFKYPP